MQTQGIRRNTGSPNGDRRCDQLATRERQAGPHGVTERLVVLMKPSNVGGGKGPLLKGNARSNEGGGIGVEPNNPSKRSEVADSVARQSEGIAQLSFLCCTTRCIARTFWHSPTRAAKPRAKRQEWTIRRLRTSRGTE